MRVISIIFVLIFLFGCSIVIHTDKEKWQQKQSEWEDTKKAGVAEIIDIHWSSGNIIRFKFYLVNEFVFVNEAQYSSFKCPIGSKYTLYYDPKNPKGNYYIDFTKPVFGNTSTSEEFCFVIGVTNANNYRSIWQIEDIWQINYSLLIQKSNYKSSSYFSREKQERKDIIGYWFKAKYATSNPAFSHLQIDTPYTTKENTDLKIIDIGDKTTRELNKAARKLQSGGTLYWTTSNIDLSDEAEINQEELNKMNQFLETYEPKGLLGRKLVIKVDIVDHRNIGEVLVPVEREK